MFSPQAVTERYQPRPGDAPTELFRTRMKACGRCSLRQVHSCRLANQLVSILARPAGAVCPNRSWPGDSPIVIDQPKAAVLPRRSADFPAVAIVIICHNYGRYLAEATESALAQTVRPACIVVVDDSSTDDTPTVARAYRSRGVVYKRIEAGNVLAALRAGFEATSNPILCFLDADDILQPDYLERGLPAFTDQRVGIVYSDMERFGDETGLTTFPPPYEGTPLDQQNRCHSASLIRRTAAEASGVFDPDVQLAPFELQDWFIARRLAAHGWRLAKSPALIRYRRHAASWMATAALDERRGSYFHLGALAHEILTLFVPLSGREWAWPLTRDFLERQTWPHSQIRLIFCDTSADPRFGSRVRDWLFESDYADVRYYRQSVPRPGVADENRHDETVARIVDATMPRIYNPMIQQATTEYVWVLEDDIIPPLDAAERLLRSFGPDVASVAAVYRNRFRAGQLIVWDRRGKFFEEAAMTGAGVLTVGGNGFGCTIVRRSVLRETIFYHNGPASKWYDVNFYSDLATTRRHKALADFQIVCEHLEAQ